MPYSKPRQVVRGGTLRPLLCIGALVGLALAPQFEQAWAVVPHGPAPASELAGGGAALAQQFEPFTQTFIRSLAPYAAALLALVVLTLRLGRRLSEAAGRESPAAGGLAAGAQSGASVIEFALLLPFLLTLLLLILQVSLIVQAKFVVNYAAFCAARAAVVTIPAKIYSRRTRRYEINNAIHLNHPASPKMRIIRRAAALPCTAISPVMGLSPTSGLKNPELMLSTQTLPLEPSFYEGLLRVALYPGNYKGHWVGQELFQRASYAYDEENTTVEVIREGGAGAEVEFDEQGNQTRQRGLRDHDLVTVRVRFRYYLAVPGANRLIGRAYIPGWLNFLTRTAYYAEMVEQYTLPLEGEPLHPDDNKSNWPDEIEVEEYE